MTLRTVTHAMIALVLGAAAISPSWAEAPTAGQQERFMNACMQKRNKEKVCRCAYKGNAAVLTRQQMELAIANILKDKKRQNAIEADPGFDMDGYNAVGQKAMMLSLLCLGGK